MASLFHDEARNEGAILAPQNTKTSVFLSDPKISIYSFDKKNAKDSETIPHGFECFVDGNVLTKSPHFVPTQPSSKRSPFCSTLHGIRLSFSIKMILPRYYVLCSVEYVQSELVECIYPWSMKDEEFFTTASEVFDNFVEEKSRRARK